MVDQSHLEMECPDWASVNDDGMWCNFCGELLIAAWHRSPALEPPECCRTCGGPDDIDAMAEFFT